MEGGVANPTHALVAASAAVTLPRAYQAAYASASMQAASKAQLAAEPTAAPQLLGPSAGAEGAAAPAGLLTVSAVSAPPPPGTRVKKAGASTPPAPAALSALGGGVGVSYDGADGTAGVGSLTKAALRGKKKAAGG